MLTRIERAKQFLPFDALNGLKNALREKEVEYVDKLELSDEQKQDLSEKLQVIGNGENIIITYYIHGRYNTINGRALFVNPIRKIINVSKVEIPFSNIYNIQIV